MLPKLQNYLQSPVHFGWVNFGGHPNGDALDIGWRASLNNKNQDLFGLGEGKVLDVSWTNDGGNTITIGSNYDKDWDVWYSVMHMRYESPLSIGDVIGRKTKIGNMGNTGISHGEHAHIRLTFVPKGTKFSWGAYGSYSRSNPYDYIYQTRGMDVIDMKHMPNDWKNDEGYKLIPESDVYVITEPKGMRLRTSPFIKGDNVVGEISKGREYKYNAKVESDGFMWVTDGKTFVARRELKKGGEVFGYIKSEKQPSKPKVNEYGQSVFSGTNIDFSVIYVSSQSNEALDPYHTNSKGEGYGKVSQVISGVKNPYKVELNGVVIGFVRPVNVYRTR